MGLALSPKPEGNFEQELTELTESFDLIRKPGAGELVLSILLILSELCLDSETGRAN